VYVNVSLEKLTFTFINILLEWSSFYYYSHSCKFNDPWTNDSPHFPFFCFFPFFLNLIFFNKTHYEILDFFLWKMHVWMNECINFFRRWTYEYMVFFNAYIVHVWKIFFWKKKAFMNAWFFWMHIWFMFEWFFLWENEFMKFWNFSFWKYIYKCMIFFGMHI